MLISPSAPQHHFRTVQAELLSAAPLLCKENSQNLFLTKVHEATEGGFESNGKLKTERVHRMGSQLK